MVISLNHSNVVNVVCGRPSWLAAAFEGREEALAHRVGVGVAGRSHHGRTPFLLHRLPWLEVDHICCRPFRLAVPH